MLRMIFDTMDHDQVYTKEISDRLSYICAGIERDFPPNHFLAIQALVARRRLYEGRAGMAYV
jgi:hypothetical protein